MCSRRKNIRGTFARPEYSSRFSARKISLGNLLHRQDFWKRSVGDVSQPCRESIIRSKDLFPFRPRLVFRLRASALDVALDFTLFALRDIWIFNQLFNQPRLLRSSANPASRPTLSCGELFNACRETGYLYESTCQRDFSILCLCFPATYDINDCTTLSIIVPSICNNNTWNGASHKFNLSNAQLNDQIE